MILKIYTFLGFEIKFHKKIGEKWKSCVEISY